MKLIRAITLVAIASWTALSPAGAELVNGIKVVVHDAVITMGEIEADTMMVASELQRQYGRSPREFEKKLAEASDDALDKALQHQLILHDFNSAGYSLPESVIDEVVQEEIRARFGDRATLTKTLQAQGVTYEKWRQQAKEKFLVGQLRLKNVYRDAIVSPFKIEKYYLAHKADYQIEDQVKLRMIVLNKLSADDATAAKALATEIITKLKEGAAFSEMASVYSQGSQRNQGGDWGWVERSVLRQELAETAFTLKPGEISDAIDTPQALYIMLVEDKRMAHHKPLPEVRDEIERVLTTQERDRLQTQYLEKLKKKTFVRYF